MMHPTHEELSFSLAWEFSSVLTGYFERDRKAVAGRKYPIIGPLPTNGGNTLPINNKIALSPFLYAIYSRDGVIKYIGKATDQTVLYRWIRPDKLGSNHYWSHGTTSAKGISTIEKIADEINKGNSPVRLFFASFSTLMPLIKSRCEAKSIDSDEISGLKPKVLIKELEHYLTYMLQPAWNIQNKKKPPNSIMKECGDYWK